MTGSPAKAAVAGPRSVALIGPYGSGKSTLFEALIAAAGAPLETAKRYSQAGRDDRGEAWALLLSGRSLVDSGLPRFGRIRL